MREREKERERDTVTSSPSFPRRHKILFGFIATIGVLIYAAFNVWVYQYSKGGKALSPATLWKTVTSPSSSFQRLQNTSIPPAKSREAGSGFAGQDPAPRDTGPGPYACDEYGICNNYEDAKRVGCPKTYADPHCLNACGDTKVRCVKPK